MVDYQNICREIHDLDPKIRFAGVINERGRQIAGGMKEGVTPLEQPRDSEMLYMELALRVKMRKEFDGQLGKVNFALAHRKQIIDISIPINHDILYVGTEPDADYSDLIPKILEIAREKRESPNSS